ncbi:MAG TPA: dienelactone hydrolase family protein [Thermoanaerobaculia bacterium]|jgi:carboxymethylenebutenolidase|nr:dienelactone hydrolase family protein [Thermoanaerobaculia bacterium]
MRRVALLALLFLLACQKNPALDPKREAGPLAEFGNGARGYLSLPTTHGRQPAVIVIQEWWGVNDWIRSQADRFAQQGYVALAVDLYRGRSASSMEEAHELSRGLPEDRAIADLKAAVDYLAKRNDVDPQRIGVIGWCLGGGYALALATNDPRPKATVINYGRLVTDPNAIAKINGEILGSFGGADRGIPAADVRKFAEELTRHGKRNDVKIYEGAGHAFMNPNNAGGYDEAAARDAWGRIDRFFGRTLRANMPNS